MTPGIGVPVYCRQRSRLIEIETGEIEIGEIEIGRGAD